MNKSFAVLALSILAAGCVAPEASNDGANKGEYRTGSNIPRKNGSGERVDSVQGGDLPRTVGNPGMPGSR